VKRSHGEREESAELPGIPAAPWGLRGTMWLGRFRLTRPATVPPVLTALMPQRLLVAAVRYLEGDLIYDALMIASPVVGRHRMGLHIHHLRISNTSVLQASLELWKQPAQSAAFSWTGPRTEVTGDPDFRAVLRIRPRTRRSVPIPLLLPTFTGMHGELTYAMVRGHAHARPATLKVLTWPQELPPLHDNTTTVALDLTEFRIKVPIPHLITRWPGGIR
jgi:hypothetical protein